MPATTPVQKLIVLLLLVNLVVTTAVLLRVYEHAPDPARSAKQGADVQEETGQAKPSRAQMVELADHIQRAYNAGDAAALYRLYGDQAQEKLTESDVAEQLAQLKSLFGDITTLRYINSMVMGEQAGAVFHQVHFAAKVRNPSLRGAQLVLHVIESGQGIGLYGMRLNAAQ